MRIWMLLPVILLTGCTIFGRTHYVEPKRPILPVPDREELVVPPPEEDLFAEDGTVKDTAALKEAYDIMVANFIKVANREATLQAVIDEYNRTAEEKNIANGYTLPPEEDDPQE